MSEVALRGAHGFKKGAERATRFFERVVDRHVGDDLVTGKLLEVFHAQFFAQGKDGFRAAIRQAGSST
jgi:hypothetical protein